MYFDSDDSIFLLFFDPKGGCGLLVFIVVAVLLIGAIIYSADKCETKCQGESRVLDNECYCVGADGSLKLAP